MPASTVCHRCRLPYGLPGRCPRCSPAQARTPARAIRATHAWRILSELARQGGRCSRCKGRFLAAQLQADHIIPASVRPDLALEPSNIRPLCRRCHTIVGREQRQYQELDT